MGCGHRRGGDRLALLVQAAEKLVDDPIGGRLAVAALGDCLVIIGLVLLRDQHARIIGGEAVFFDEAGLFVVGQFRQMAREFVDIGLGEFKRQKVRIGEIAVIMRFFLRAHRACLALGRIVKPRLLRDRAAILQNADLAARLIFDCLPHKADGVHILDFAACAEAFAGATHRDIHIGAQGAFIHIAVARAQIPQNGTEFRHIGARLFG